MSDFTNVGKRIRTVRESRKISVADLAERAGLHPDLVAALEQNQLPPSLAPLIKIARVLGVRLGTFLDDVDSLGPVITRADAQVPAVRFAGRTGAVSSDLDFYSLAHNKAGRHMEPFIIDIHGSSSEDVHTSSHEGEEFIYVLTGAVEVFYGKETYVLHEGDSIYLDSIVEHHVHSTAGEARILAVVYTPY
ncbi:helix-turn-helix domain-containing protein [Gracilinema caldarium]|uniref:Helix-turn-helix domain protein n=1 Tax=Gracilinema caldarium (strain ATCC 51460 / DSM 7334 / H1) TaxID=744872 RepID=F8F491_GRAC1|nr:XRE family transcriptional regulator [Gracilinema caldarium]AEJ20538.1 helix-turn-helix domain protein [Gracilinema caldarium DSM 7334]